MKNFALWSLLLIFGVACTSHSTDETRHIQMQFNSYETFQLNSITLNWKSTTLSKGNILFTEDSILFEEKDFTDHDYHLYIDTFFGNNQYSKFNCLDKDSVRYEVGVVPVRSDSSKYVVNFHCLKSDSLFSFKTQLLYGK